MIRVRKLLHWGVALGIAVAVPAEASRFARMGLDALVGANETIVVGEAVDAQSYWNDSGTFILTDVTFVVSELLKGAVDGHEITVTLAGGTVGDLSTVIVGGAELVPGKAYLLFLRKKDIVGTRGVLTPPDHSQGVFELKRAVGGLRAVSQAIGHELVPDARGLAEPPGAAAGTPFESFRQSVRDLVALNRKEVQR